MEVNALGEPTGKFRKKSVCEILKPIGECPENWLDNIHEFDGHGVDDLPESREGEIILKSELDSLYVQNGIEARSTMSPARRWTQTWSGPVETSRWVSSIQWASTTECPDPSSAGPPAR